MVRSRVYGILAGYEDQNDHDTLHHDPVLKLVADRSPEDDDLAGQPTLSSFENAISIAPLKRLRDIFFHQFIASFETPPRPLTFALDAVDDPAHGQQQLTLWHGYYDQPQALPTKPKRPLPAGLDAAFNAPIAGAVFVLEELVRRFETRAAVAALGASATAIAVSRLFLGDVPDFAVDPLAFAGPHKTALFYLLGVVAGLLAVAYNRTRVMPPGRQSRPAGSRGEGQRGRGEVGPAQDVAPGRFRAPLDPPGRGKAVHPRPVDIKQHRREPLFGGPAPPPCCWARAGLEGASTRIGLRRPSVDLQTALGRPPQLPRSDEGVQELVHHLPREVDGAPELPAADPGGPGRGYQFYQARGLGHPDRPGSVLP
jgi:hypothetical protein